MLSERTSAKKSWLHPLYTNFTHFFDVSTREYFILFVFISRFARKLQFSLSFLENLNPRKKLHKYRIVCGKLKRGINGDEVVSLDIHM